MTDGRWRFTANVRFVFIDVARRIVAVLLLTSLLVTVDVAYGHLLSTFLRPAHGRTVLKYLWERSQSDFMLKNRFFRFDLFCP